MTDGGTRQLILLQAARLFGKHGYYGTTTREIADAVGIRQPSLFYHFPAKHSILAELVDADLAQTMSRLEEAVALDASWAERFHFFVTLSSRDYLTLPYDARGYYSDALFAEEEFAPQREGIERFHDAVRRFVEAGIEAGEFLAVDPEFVQRAITGLQFEGMRERETSASAPVSERPLQVSDFILRAVLVQPSRLEDLRTRTQERLPRPVAS
ncbi:TetR/AcrR family transcriptional regulator [Leifsonia sp. 22587]|uniref:TetR/AcrR family transcriptional regulator n=1 Tax=Leifsonia sp. 22587 TaxID=3453946 RepID=UPI003F83C24E